MYVIVWHSLLRYMNMSGWHNSSTVRVWLVIQSKFEVGKLRKFIELCLCVSSQSLLVCPYISMFYEFLKYRVLFAILTFRAQDEVQVALVLVGSL